MFEVDSSGVATKMPNSEVLAEWADALESGEYGQTNNVLRNNSGFCCLGVLCELAVRHGVIQEAVEILDSNDEPLGEFSYGGHDAFLPRAVSEWAFGDPNKNNPDMVTEDNYTESASSLNDSLEYSFQRIAAAIRRTYNV